MNNLTLQRPEATQSVDLKVYDAVTKAMTLMEKKTSQSILSMESKMMTQMNEGFKLVAQAMSQRDNTTALQSFFEGVRRDQNVNQLAIQRSLQLMSDEKLKAEASLSKVLSGLSGLKDDIRKELSLVLSKKVDDMHQGIIQAMQSNPQLSQMIRDHKDFREEREQLTMKVLDAIQSVKDDNVQLPLLHDLQSRMNRLGVQLTSQAATYDDILNSNKDLKQRFTSLGDSLEYKFSQALSPLYQVLKDRDTSLLDDMNKSLRDFKSEMLANNRAVTSDQSQLINRLDLFSKVLQTMEGSMLKATSLKDFYEVLTNDLSAVGDRMTELEATINQDRTGSQAVKQLYSKLSQDMSAISKVTAAMPSKEDYMSYVFEAVKPVMQQFSNEMTSTMKESGISEEDKQDIIDNVVKSYDDMREELMSEMVEKLDDMKSESKQAREETIQAVLKDVVGNHRKWALEQDDKHMRSYKDLLDKKQLEERQKAKDELNKVERRILDAHYDSHKAVMADLNKLKDLTKGVDRLVDLSNSQKSLKDDISRMIETALSDRPVTFESSGGAKMGDTYTVTSAGKGMHVKIHNKFKNEPMRPKLPQDVKDLLIVDRTVPFYFTGDALGYHISFQMLLHRVPRTLFKKSERLETLSSQLTAPRGAFRYFFCNAWGNRIPAIWDAVVCYVGEINPLDFKKTYELPVTNVNVEFEGDDLIRAITRVSWTSHTINTKFYQDGILSILLSHHISDVKYLDIMSFLESWWKSVLAFADEVEGKSSKPLTGNTILVAMPGVCSWYHNLIDNIVFEFIKRKASANEVPRSVRIVVPDQVAYLYNAPRGSISVQAIRTKMANIAMHNGVRMTDSELRMHAAQHKSEESKLNNMLRINWRLAHYCLKMAAKAMPNTCSMSEMDVDDPVFIKYSYEVCLGDVVTTRYLKDLQ